MFEIEKYKTVKVSKLIEFLIFISIFINSYVFFKQPFEGYLHYLIFIFFSPLFFIKFGYPKFLFKLLLVLVTIGLLQVFFGVYPVFDFVKVFGGMILSTSFYYYVIRFYKYNVIQLFSIYLKWSYYAALIGLFQLISYLARFTYGYDFRWVFNKWTLANGGFFGLRVNSVFMEPSALAAVLAPAVYVAVYNLMHKKNFILNKKQSIILLLVYVLSSSSTAYIGLMLIVALVTVSVRFRYIIIAGVVGIFAFNIFYTVSPEFRSRVDSSIGLWINQEYTLENTNTSSFVLYNNFHVATQSFLDHPFFGTGLGSYKAAYQKYSLTKNKEVIAYDFEFNTSDGNSLFIRMLVEVGLIGVVFFFILLFKGFIYLRTDEELLHYKIISQALLIMILLNLLRQGNYFLNGFPFFVLMYYYNWVAYQKHLQNKN